MMGGVCPSVCRVPCARVMGFHPANFYFLGLSVLGLIEARDSQADGLTDRQIDTGHHFIMPPPYRG